ncbi:MAG: hypothetical protein JXM70_07980 [Pirellulales bacterium]|nr:hypothetical protein [Pirellulales bacterium]
MNNLVSIFEAAARWSSHWQDIRDWFELGMMPKPSIVDGFVRWHVDDLRSWEAADCPLSEQLPEAECLRFEAALLAELKERDRVRDNAPRRLSPIRKDSKNESTLSKF